MGNKKHSKCYTDDFRKKIVGLYNSGQRIIDISGEYGVSEVTIYRWIKKLNPIELGDGSSVTPKDYAEFK